MILNGEIVNPHKIGDKVTYYRLYNKKTKKYWCGYNGKEWVGDKEYANGYYRTDDAVEALALFDSPSIKIQKFITVLTEKGWIEK